MHVSVIIPTYNRCELVVEAIASCIRSAPALKVEIIVIDDASKEDVASAIRGFDVRLYRLEKNSGSSVARNLGISESTGDFIKFLDSDDVLADGALQREYSVACGSNADITVSGWEVVDLAPDGKESSIACFDPPEFSVIADDLLLGKAVPTSSALYARRTLAETRWDAALSKLNDWDFFISAALCARTIATVESIAYRWRQHAGERIVNTSSFLKNANEFFRILEKLELALRAQGTMTRPRELRLAQYLYKELRGAYRFDPDLGRRKLAHILELDPDFAPRDEEMSQLFRALGRLIPLHPLLTAYGTARRLADRITTVPRQNK